MADETDNTSKTDEAHEKRKVAVAFLRSVAVSGAVDEKMARAILDLAGITWGNPELDKDF